MNKWKSNVDPTGDCYTSSAKNTAHTKVNGVEIERGPYGGLLQYL